MTTAAPTVCSVMNRAACLSVRPGVMVSTWRVIASRTFIPALLRSRLGRRVEVYSSAGGAARCGRSVEAAVQPVDRVGGLVVVEPHAGRVLVGAHDQAEPAPRVGARDAA